MSPPLFP